MASYVPRKGNMPYTARQEHNYSSDYVRERATVCTVFFFVFFFPLLYCLLLCMGDGWPAHSPRLRDCVVREARLNGHKHNYSPDNMNTIICWNVGLHPATPGHIEWYDQEKWLLYSSPTHSSTVSSNRSTHKPTTNRSVCRFLAGTISQRRFARDSPSTFV